MDSEAKYNGIGIELLTQSNYKIWRTCLKSYLIGEDLWDVVDGDSINPPQATAENVNALKRWRKTNAKAESVLKRCISHGLFDHIMSCESANAIWTTLEGLLNKKDVARLQILENELANTTQGDLSISQFFLKIKNLCSEISILDPEEPISEGRMKRHIIRGLKRDYIPFVTSVQGWATQPSLVEFENLLTSQESLARQMAGCSISTNDGDALFSGKKKNYGKKKEKVQNSKNHASSGKQFGDGGSTDGNKPGIRCNRCGILGHIRKNCRVKLKGGNVAAKDGDHKGDDEWGNCFMAETKSVEALASINFDDDWIVDSGCGHHLTGDHSKFSSFREYKGKDAIITADNSVHPVEKEGVVTIKGNGDDAITLKSVFQVPGMKKNLFSVANAVDSGSYVLFGPTDVKFLRNISNLDADIVHTGKRVKDLYVLSSTSYVDSMSANDGASVWHARLGHIGMDKLKAMVLKNLVDGLPKLTTFGNGEICEGCQYGKAHRLPFDKSSSRCEAPLELVHSDLMGPCVTPSFSGSRYMLLFVDDFTRYTWVYFVKEKADVLSKFKEFKATVEGVLDKKIRKLRTDNGGEFTSNDFHSFCRENGIKRELSCAYTPQQNGIAERKIRHIVETCKSWLHAKRLPKALWAEGMACATYVINRVPLSPNNMRSPYELMFGVKPNVKHFKVFGSICYVHVPDGKRTKLDAKARKCIFIGYDERKKGWKCMDPGTHKFVVSRDVIFDEVSSFYEVDGGAPLRDVSSNSQLPIDPQGEVSLSISSNSPSVSGDNLSSSVCEEQYDRGSGVQCHEDNVEEIESAPPLRRSKRTIVLPSRYRDGNFVNVHSCFLAIDDDEPSCFEEAKGVKEWDGAMKEEMQALLKNQTWDLVPNPKDMKPISCKWVYKIKRNANGDVERYKARLVARGFSQKYGEDYEETFSPVAKMTSVRVVISLAACYGWKLWQLDVKNAFLYGEIDRDIYMEQPLGFVSHTHPDYVCKLKKALYGLKQAPRAWYGKIAEYLQFCGYLASNSDSSLFVKKHGDLHIIVVLYVDDMIVTGNNNEEVDKLRSELSIRFEMKDLGMLNHFLGLEVETLEDGLFLSQKCYAKNMVSKFGLDESKKCSTPLDANLKLRRDEGKLLPDPRPYRALVGSLIYLTISRPDIAFSVGFVSRFMQAPRKPHFEAAKRILKYVSSTFDLGLFFKKKNNFELKGFSDADFGGDLDDRRSTSGYVFFLGPTCISWCSKKQDSVSLSTTESEYKAASLAAQECVWLRRLVEDVTSQIYKPTTIFGDNQSALKLVSNPVCHARTKHIEIEHHFIREKVLEKLIAVEEVRSNDNIADIFTKSLSKGPFELLRSKLGIISRKSL